jgi:hypothetical protein
MNHKLLIAGIVSLIAPAALVALLSARHHPGHDYLPMHAAAMLVRSGENPYHLAGLIRVEQTLRDADPALYQPGEFIAYYYPPWLALACVPLTALSYPLAKGVWVYLAFQSLMLAGYGLRRLPGLPSPLLILLGLLAVPACLGAHMGQTSALVLLLLVVAWRLIERGADVWGGVALAWLNVKPQMSVVVIPAVLVWSARQGRWNVARGFAAMLGGLCLASTLLIPTWPWDMLQAPRLSPLPSATNPEDGVTWLSALQTLGLKGRSLVLAYAAAAVSATVLVLRAGGNRVRASSEVFALGAVAAFFVSPHSLGYDFTILLFPLLAFLSALPERLALRLVVAVMLGYNVQFATIQGGTSGLALVSLFWMPAGLAIWAIAREARRGAGEPNRHVDRIEAALGDPGLRADHAPGLDPGPSRLGAQRAGRAGQPRPGTRAGLGRGVPGPEGLRELPGGARRPGGSGGLHSLAE